MKKLVSALLISSAIAGPIQANAQDGWTVLGALLGAGIGAHHNQGGSAAPEAILGGMIGAFVGSAIGSSLNQSEHGHYTQSYRQSLQGNYNSYGWQSPNHYGYHYVGGYGYVYQGQRSIQCREMISPVFDYYHNLIGSQVSYACFEYNQWVTYPTNPGIHFDYYDSQYDRYRRDVGQGTRDRGQQDYERERDRDRDYRPDRRRY